MQNTCLNTHSNPQLKNFLELDCMQNIKRECDRKARLLKKVSSTIDTLREKEGELVIKEKIISELEKEDISDIESALTCLEYNGQIIQVKEGFYYKL